ncbi:MAG: S8 family peptidase, partial [Ghiorsea sp.]
GNGFIDDVHGWDFLNHDNDPSADASVGEGHGTMVAGCIGAVGNNGLGVSGVNWNVSIMPIKFVPDVAGELAAMDYAIANGAKIINASWGGPQFSYAESAAAQKLLQNGILLVAAAGNYHGNNDRVADYPSGLPYPNILSVSSFSFTGTLSAWAHYGATSIDVTAPGESIYTTTTPDQYDYTDGTSFSAPLTAGVAALILAQYPTATYQDIKGRIMASSTKMQQHGLSATDGRINAGQALSINPQPELVISSLQLNDNNNNLIDPNESISLNITLENVWQATTGITATLTTTDPLVSIATATSSWIDLNMGQKAAANVDFALQIGDFIGYRSIPFSLTITTASGHTFMRHFSLTSGRLLPDTTYQANTMQHEQDLFQYYHIDVAAGQPLLNITSKANADVDILLKYGSQPLFDYNSYDINPVYGRDKYTQVSATGFTGNEQIIITHPQAGTWHVVVASFDRQAASYELLASTTSSLALVPNIPQSTSRNQSVCIQPAQLFSPSSLFFVLSLLAFKLLVLKKRHQKG